MISGGKSVRAGVDFLCNAVEPMALTEELRKAGLQQSESFEFTPPT